MRRSAALGIAILIVASAAVALVGAGRGLRPAPPIPLHPIARALGVTPESANPHQLPDKIYRRWEAFFLPRAYPLGYLPEGARLKGARQLREAIAAWQARSALESVTPVAERWFNVGPAPTEDAPPSPFLESSSSGRVADVAIDPADTRHWLIAAASGGVWESKDSGLTWAPRTDDQPTLSMGALAFAESDPNIVYAGTGEGPVWGGLGVGILKSLDGGTTWTHVATSPFERTGIHDLKVDPTNPDVLVAVSSQGAFGKQVDTFSIQVPQLRRTGVYKSTDGGRTWAKKIDHGGADLEPDPRDFNRLYAAIGPRETVLDPNAPPFVDFPGIYRSLDAGEIWARVAGPWESLPNRAIGRGEMAVSPSNPDTIYVSLVNADPRNFPGTMLGLWRSDDAWSASPTWSRIDMSGADLVDGSGNFGYCHSQCFYDNEMIVDPANPDILYAGGIGLFRYDGLVWTIVGGSALSDPVHVDQHSFAWAGSRLVVGNDGGVFSTADGGSTWTIHNSNLSTTQWYWGSMHPGGANSLIAGSQDNGAQHAAGAGVTPAWKRVLSGDGTATAYSPSRPDSRWAVSAQGVTIARTKSDGILLESVGAPPGFFLTPFAICPGDDDVAVAGAIFSVSRTDDLFSTPDGVLPTWRTQSPKPGLFFLADAITFFPGDSSCSIYAAGGLFDVALTMDGGQSWHLAKDFFTPGVPDRAVTDIAFDPRDANVLYVSLSGFEDGTPGEPGHLLKTANALDPTPTWVDVSPPLDAPHNTVLVDPFEPDIVFVGTDFGVWKSPDGGTTWEPMGPSTGMPEVIVHDLAAARDSRRIVAFTHGRGAFVLARAGACSGGPVLDFDGDGVGDDCDNCPAHLNRGQEDGDGDGQGDSCDCGVDFYDRSLDQDVDGCVDSIASLTNYILNHLELPPSQRNPLLRKLVKAQNALDRGDVAGAVRRLHSFIQSLRGDANPLIAPGDVHISIARFLIAYAENVIVALET